MFILEKNIEDYIQAKKDKHLILAVKQDKVIWMLLFGAGVRTVD